MTTKDTAIILHDLGYKPVLVPAGEKGPRDAAWQDREYTREQLAERFDRQPELNVGILLGDVMDIEGDGERAPEEFARLFAGCETPVTTSWHARRGVHYLFQADQRLTDLGKASFKFGQLDVRLGAKKAAQSLLPPSQSNGFTRGWIVPLSAEYPPAKLPDAVVERLLEAARSPVVKSGYDRALVLCQRIKTKDGKDGSRRLFAICCRGVEHDLTADQIVSLVREVEAEKPFPKQFSDTEVRQRIADAEQKCERGSALISKPAINVSVIDLAIINERLWRIITDKNKPPVLFRYAGQPSRIELDDKSQPIIVPATFDIVRHHLSNWVHFFKRNTAGEDLPCVPPKPVVEDLLATPNLPLPILTRIVDAPVFANDGTLLTEPGYHPASRTYFCPSPGFQLKEISDRPTGEDVETARKLLVDELLHDFPFTSESEKAHAVALLLLPFARSLIEGPTPFHLVEKPSPGTGASLLVNCLHTIATGREASIMSEGRCEEEWRKRLTAKLRTGPQFVTIDNIKLPLESAAVAAALTAQEWEDRILGVSEVVRIPIQNVWVGTGNNPPLSDEIARRTIRIRLDAKTDQPWLRDEFKIPNLGNWVIEKRPQLVHACLILIQNWIAAGRPEGKQTLGMYERWSKVMGGILTTACIPGFLGNLADFYTKSDTAGSAWRALLANWWENYHDAEIKADDLFSLALAETELSLGGGNERSQRIKLGKLLAENRDRVFQLDAATVRLDKTGISRGKPRWRLTAAIPALAV